MIIVSMLLSEPVALGEPAALIPQSAARISHGGGQSYPRVERRMQRVPADYWFFHPLAAARPMVDIAPQASVGLRLSAYS